MLQKESFPLKRRSPRKYASTSINLTDDDFQESPAKHHQPAPEKVSRCGRMFSSTAGMMFLAFCITDWVMMAEVIQSSESAHYDKPFLIRWSVNSTYCLMIIPWLFVRQIERYFPRQHSVSSVSWTNAISSVWSRSLSETEQKSRQKSPLSFHRTDQAIILDANEKNSGELVIDGNANPAVNAFCRMTLTLIAINAVNLLTGYAWYLSLSRTVASLNNTIYQSNCVFVLLFSYFLLNEKVTFQKLLACAVAIGGVALIMRSMPPTSSTASGSNSVVGIIFNALSMMLWAVYEVAFTFVARKHFRSDHQLSDTLLFQCGCGVVNMLFFWPFVALLHYLEIESFQLPSGRAQLMGEAMPCLMDTLYTAGMLCGITLSGAMFMSMGMILVIPLTFFADIIVFKKQEMDIVNAYSVIGAFCIVVGFVLIQKRH